MALDLALAATLKTLKIISIFSKINNITMCQLASVPFICIHSPIFLNVYVEKIRESGDEVTHNFHFPAEWCNKYFSR